MPLIEINQVVKRYGAVEVLKGLNMQVEQHQVVCLIGPSGCGKSTLLRMIAGLEEVSGGTIHIGGDDVTTRDPSQRGIAMVFQSYALYPHMSVADNIGFGLKLSGMPKAEIEARVREAAETLQLTHLLDRKPKQLSGGQRQRVAIGRAIVRKPKVFLFDEPLSNLDAALRAQMRVELAELHSRIGATMVYVTHDQVEAMTMADRIVVLKDGHIEQAGAPMELYRKPATPFVAGFIGSPRMNFISSEEARKLGGDTIGIRPEHLRIAEDAQWPVMVRHVEHLGSETLIYVTSETLGPLTIKAEGDAGLSAGETIHVGYDAADLHRFKDGTRV
jgi:multiple sugar transport system ATP-binding protein